MDLKQLQELGGFVPKLPIKRPVTWQPVNDDGTPKGDELTFDVFIRKLSFGALERLFDDKQPIDRQRMSAYIADAVSLGDEGKQRISYQQAMELEPTLATALMNAVGEVNSVKKQEVKTNGEAEPEAKN
jgi:hypothetical protein